jgi:hypothetical protein
MGRGEKIGHLAWILVAMVTSCNGQFDFDPLAPDTGAPIVTIEASAEDLTLPIDVPVEPPKGTGLRIACGSSDCLTLGCCSSSSGFACTDVASGGTCNGILIQCDDTDDCPAGLVCCAEGDDRNAFDCPDTTPCDTDGTLKRVHCETEAHCRNLGYVVLCNPDRPDLCAQCEDSSISGLPPDYHQCNVVP